MTPDQLTCERDGTPTRLTCVQCRVPICPQCFVRTPVGMKCQRCGAEVGGASGRARRGRPAWVPLAVLGVVLAVATALFLPQLLKDDKPAAVEQNPLEGIPNPQGPARFAPIGMEAKDGDLAFTVTTVECGATQVPGAATATVAQGQFCFVSLEIRNDGRNPATFTARTQVLFDRQNRRFGPDAAATAAHPANTGRDLQSLVVNPGNQVRAVMAFDVPPDVTPVYAELHSGQTQGAFVGLQPPGAR